MDSSRANARAAAPPSALNKALRWVSCPKRLGSPASIADGRTWSIQRPSWNQAVERHRNGLA